VLPDFSVILALTDTSMPEDFRCANGGASLIVGVCAHVFDPLEEETMNTQSKSDVMVGPDGWAGIDDRQFETQRSGGGFLTLLMFPLIALAALAFAAAELAR
jgi:hypothetical protein